jgi:hypothetical protein
MEKTYNKTALESIRERYLQNLEDSGHFGRCFEVDMRHELINTVERVHPLGVADVTIKAGVTLECKTACGWIVNPQFDTPEEAKAYIEEKTRPMKKAMFVAYLPQYNGENLEDARILSQTSFLNMLKEAGLLRAKKGSSKNNPQYGIAIQSYLPTKSFHPSMKTLAFVEGYLMEHGETVEEYVERMSRA